MMEKPEIDEGAHVVWVRGTIGPEIQLVFGPIPASLKPLMLTSIPLRPGDLEIAKMGLLPLKDVDAVYTPQSIRDLQFGAE